MPTKIAKKLTLYISLTGFLAGCCPQSPDSKSDLRTGTEFGNGAGGDENFAWFATKARLIKTCIKDSKDFEISNDEFVKTLSQVLSTWRDYLAGRQSVASVFNSLNYQFQESCDDETDLAFYLGSSPETVVEGNLTVRQLTASHQGPAIGYLTQALPKWARGIVWIDRAPEPGLRWSDHGGLPLYGLLMHETGHILGSGHVAGTIMSLDLPRLFKNPGDFAAQLQTIDWETMLARPTAYQAESSYIRPVDESARRAFFTRLTKREPASDYNFGLRIDHDHLALLLSDAKGATEFPLARQFDQPRSNPEAFEVKSQSGPISTMLAEAGLVSSSGSFFQIDREDTTVFDNNMGRTSLRLQAGNQAYFLEVGFNQGGEGAPVMVYWMRDGIPVELFRAPTPYDREPHNPFKTGIMRPIQ